jgi:hypothetical protein
VILKEDSKEESRKVTLKQFEENVGGFLIEDPRYPGKN